MSKMFKYKQVIREDGVEVITVIHKGIHTFNPTSLVFPFIKECIEADKELYPIDDIISHKVITPCKMELKNHRFTILGEEIEDSLIMEHSDKLELLQHLFLNLRNHTYDKKKTLDIFKLNASSIKPMTDDGFVFLVESKGDFSKTPIFYANNSHQTIEEYKKLKLGKKLNQVLLSKMLNVNEINPFPFNLMKNFSKTWDENQLRDLLAVDFGYTQERNYERLYSFYEFYFNSPKRFLNIVNKQEIPANLLDKFAIVKKYLDPSIKVSNITKLHEFLNKTYENHKTKLDWERLIQKHPIVEKMNGIKISGFTLKCPKDAGEITLWGNLMSNCFGGRVSSYQRGDVCLFGLFDKSDKLSYVFEIRYNKVKTSGRYGDFEGKRREAPPIKLKESLTKRFLKECNFIL
jgi:hypothetical protein